MRDLFDLVGTSPRDEHVVTAFGKTAAQRRAETTFRADTDYDCDWFAHCGSSHARKNRVLRMMLRRRDRGRPDSLES